MISLYHGLTYPTMLPKKCTPMEQDIRTMGCTFPPMVLVHSLSWSSTYTHHTLPWNSLNVPWVSHILSCSYISPLRIFKPTINISCTFLPNTIIPICILIVGHSVRIRKCQALCLFNQLVVFFITTSGQQVFVRVTLVGALVILVYRQHGIFGSSHCH